jgi:hypothetical protein
MTRNHLDAITTAFFADVDVAVTALQDILVVTCIAHLAPEASAGSIPMNALETP